MPGGRVLALAAAVAAVSASAAAAPSFAPGSSAAPRRAEIRSTTLEVTVLQRVNGLRREHGLVPLRRSQQLAAAADAHSRELAAGGYFAHASPDGSAFWRRVRRFYPATLSTYWSTGENLLWSSRPLDAAEALRMWLASPEHRRNLLAPRWREVGLGAIDAEAAPGVFGGRRVVILTADFGVRRS